MQKLLLPLRWLSKILSKIVTAVVLTLVYFLGIGLTSILGKIFCKDFIGLKRKSNAASYWLPYQEKQPTLENFMKPY